MMKQLFCFLHLGTVLVIAGSFSICPPVRAELIVSPEAVIIAGDRTSKISTTLTVSDEKSDSKLKIAVSDVRRADGAAIIPANKFVIKPAAIALPPNAPSQINLTIDLAQASSNGEFVGSLYFYQASGRRVIPLTVRIKEAPMRPWLVMLAGVALGTSLSIYRVDGRSRDEIVVQVSRLQNQMNGDPELSKDFKSSIESKLVGVSSAIEDKDWETAKKAVASARELWNRWQEFRDDWIAQLKYGEQLIADKDIKTETLTIFMQGVKDNLEAVYRKLRAGQYQTPADLSTNFSEVREQLSFYRSGETAVDNLKVRRNDLPDDRANFWLQELDALQTKLDCSKPDQESRKNWQELLDREKKELEDEIIALKKDEAPSEPGSSLRGRSGMNGLVEENPVLLQPRISIIPTGQQVATAAGNLWRFKLTSRLVAIVFLAWLGMIELYSGKPTFGAEPLRDYFALLAWGFGAEMTRESIARVSQNLGLPFENQ